MQLSARAVQSFARRRRSFVVASYHAANENVRTSRFESHRLDYRHLVDRLAEARRVLSKPENLTLTEKILYAHLDLAPSSSSPSSYMRLRPDRVACQDATATMALLQLMAADIRQVAVPTTVHCDHLIAAHAPSAEHDLRQSEAIHDEVYAFLAAACSASGIGFWRPGSGIVHQVLLENYAFPGGLIVGTDAHTPHAGGLGMLGVGVGGTEAVEVMAGLPWELKTPKVVGVRLTGKLSGWASPKDIILKVAGILGSQGGRGAVLEYCGPGVDTLSCTGMATLCNMGAELGAISSMFPFTQRMHDFLCATHRDDVAHAAQAIASTYLSADNKAQYDDVIKIALDTIEPHINGPFTPNLSTPVDEFKAKATEEEWPEALSAALVGSCTNASYMDVRRAAEIARQAAEKGLKVKIPFMVSPGSEQVRATLERDGHLGLFEAVGGSLLANACGPCIGQWDRKDDYDKPSNSIVTSYNQNVQGRHDGNPNTHAFVASPEIVMAMAFAGTLSFNPTRDRIVGADGIPFKFNAPVEAGEVPHEGYCSGATDAYYQAPASDGHYSSPATTINPKSTRLQVLAPFAAWDGEDIDRAPILIKVRGQCTADHISMAGPWLKYRGHLDNISNNLLILASNADENGAVNLVRNVETREYAAVPETARYYKARGIRWVVVADENYGEGPSREHAALAPRYLNGVAVIARSFGRIHETNLKKQGMLPLTFVDPLDYDKIDPADQISIVGLKEGMGKVRCLVHKPWGDMVAINLAHTFNQDQLEWFKAGSALNTLRTTRA